MWEFRSLFFFYFDFFVDFLKLSIYSTFFAIIIKYYGIPLHIIRDLYLTIRSFVVRVKDILRYRRATANMDQRYPDATEAELEASDKICIICREEMTSAKKLTCGHLFHFRCLKSWLERQQACPTCRRSILDPPETPANPEHNGDVQNLNIIEGEIRANDAPHPPELRQFSPNEHLPQVRGSLYTDIGNIPVVMINDRENIRLRLRNLLANNGSAAEQRMDESLSQPVLSLLLLFDCHALV